MLDQLFFFGLDELLAVGVARIALARSEIGQLDDNAGFAARQRNDEEIVLARQGDGRFAARPPRIRFRAGRPRDLPPRPGDRIDDDDVALIGEQDAAMRLVPLTADRRRGPAFGVREFPRPDITAVLRHDVRGGLVVARPAPLEIQPRRIAGPAQPGLRIADELRPAHDAVDRQLESTGRARGGAAGWSSCTGDNGDRRESADGARRHVHGRKVYNCPNRRPLPTVYC